MTLYNSSGNVLYGHCPGTCPYPHNETGCGGDRYQLYILSVDKWRQTHSLSKILFYFSSQIKTARHVLTLVVSPAPAKVDFTTAASTTVRRQRTVFWLCKYCLGCYFKFHQLWICWSIYLLQSWRRGAPYPVLHLNLSWWWVGNDIRYTHHDPRDEHRHR